MIDIGTGSPIVVIPGVQGRWEWMRPAIEALAGRCRVISYSLCGDRARGSADADRLHFDRLVTQLDEVLDRARLETAAVCGVSYGGLIALRYAAHHAQRVEALILASTPSPTWQPNCRVATYLRAPRLLSPVFVARSPARLWPEIAAAFPAWWARLAFSARHTARVMAAPFSAAGMAERVHALEGVDLAGDCAQVTAPTLVITGEPHLDKVVAADDTRQYLELVPQAVGATLERTGHIGFISRPIRFAEMVTTFMHDTGARVEQRRA